MSERTIDGGNFVAGTQQGDPEKLKYLHTPDWQGKTFVGGSELRVDARACPGCLFPDAPEGKWPHTRDSRCKLGPSDHGRVARESGQVGREIQEAGERVRQQQISDARLS